ncbi:hypothetical protein psyc5s11_27660 [Clostridium gelidum]|uniref:Transposase n=1 Tax=Clostridium gelidum TaxID=704125 RepID=A0ABN6IX77_9CLOT|nr:hypothetical protein [Clostridium gelidum]BCZ46699.1 hypothetical protein psyc5s11_27660 [Clostridium gelidum]
MIQKKVKSKKLKEHINSFLKKDIYKNKRIECCVICGEKNYIKHGSYKGIQRYKCKDCGKTFSNMTNSLWSYSKKDLDIWVKFMELMIKRKSLRFCAKKLKISVTTAFYWRHKILNGLKIDSIPNKLEGDVHINKTIIVENFKGCRNITTTKRSNIWVIAAKGDEDSMLVTPAFKHCWMRPIFYKNIYSKIENGSYIIPYNDTYITAVAKEHNKKLVKERKEDDRIKFIIMNIYNILFVFWKQIYKDKRNRLIENLKPYLYLGSKTRFVIGY